MVISEAIAPNISLETRGIIRALIAEIVDSVVSRMSRLEECLYIHHVVPVDLLIVWRWETHSNQLICDVCQIKIETVILESLLLL